MIRLSELKKAAVKEGVPQSVLEKDLALSVALKEISASKLTKHIVFKGGTAIRKVYFKEARFSEDLDFTASNTNKSECIVMLRKAFDEMNIEGIEFEKIREEETSAGLKASVKFIGPLGHPQRIRLDLSFRENLVKEPALTRIFDSYDFGIVELPVMSLGEIFAEKIQTLGTRSAARDLYDVWFLSEQGIEIDRQVLDKKFGFYGERFDANKAIENARHCQVSWERDLQHLLRRLPNFDTSVRLVENQLKKIALGK